MVFLIEIAVIVSTYSIDRSDDVENCLESLRNQTLQPKEILLVLDFDESLISFYQKRFKDKVKIIVSDGSGLSAARNAGIKNSQSEFIAFIDDDAMADAEWLNRLMINFKDSTVVGVGGKIVPIWPQKAPSWFPQELYWIVGCSYKGLPTAKAPVRNPIGCNMVFPRYLFDKIGLFNTSFGRVGNQLLGAEDTELGARVANRLRFSKIVYDPSAVVYHKVSMNRVSLNYVIKRSYFEGFSKAYFAKIKNNAPKMSTEKTYLKKIIKNTPNLSLAEAIILWFSTIIVLVGYFDSLMRTKIFLKKKKKV